MSETVEFTKEAVMGYLDQAIINWRRKRNETDDDLDKHIALCYIDAYQSVHIKLFSELLEPEDSKGK